MNIFGYIPDDLNNGKGMRNTIFISGCTHNCEGCHAIASHDFNYGEEFTEEIQDKLIKDSKENPLCSGITISGGDPIQSYDEVIKFCIKIKENLRKDQNLWMYTGYTWEELLELRKHKLSVLNDPKMDILKYVDTFVVGPFVQELKDPELEFMGSSNQEIINVKDRLKEIGE